MTDANIGNLVDSKEFNDVHSHLCQSISNSNFKENNLEQHQQNYQLVGEYANPLKLFQGHLTSEQGEVMIEEMGMNQENKNSYQKIEQVQEEGEDQIFA